MPGRVFICTVCGKRIDDEDDYVVMAEKWENQPEFHAHVECQEKVGSTGERLGVRRSTDWRSRSRGAKRG